MWEGQVPLSTVGWFRTLFCGLVLCRLLYSFGDQARYVASPIFDGYMAVPVIRAGVPALPYWAFISSGVGLAVCLGLAAVGIRGQLCLWLCLPLYFLYFGHLLGLSYIARKTNLIPLILLTLALTPNVGALSIRALLRGGSDRPAPAWTFEVPKLLVAMVYFGAGILKLGNQWWDGQSLQYFLIGHHLRSDLPFCWALAQQIELCCALSILTILFELGFVLALLFPRLALPCCLAALTFHAGTAWALNIWYLKYFAPAMLAFLPDVWPSRFALSADPHGRGPG